MRLRLSHVAVGLFLLVALSGCATTASFGTPRTLPPYSPATPIALSADTVCSEAQALTDAGKPADALSLIDQYRKSLPAPMSAGQLQICEPERRSALTASAQLELGATPTTGALPLQVRWSQFVASWAKPLSGPLLVSSIGIISLLMLARLGVYWQKRRTPWFLRHAGARVLFTVVAICGMLGGCLDATWALAGDEFLWAGCWLAIALLGTFLLSLVMANRMRIQIDIVDGVTTSSTQSPVVGTVAALVADLGGSPSRGINMPSGSDVTAIQNTALSIPQANAFIGAVQWIVNSVLTATPWRAVVAIQNDKSAPISVVITKNARPDSAYVISPELILPTESRHFTSVHTSSRSAAAGAEPKARADSAAAANPLNDYQFEFVAAAIVVTLSRSYAGFDGLCGAKDWRSVGLQYVATTRFGRDLENQMRMLLEAVTLDPGNRLADLALKKLQWVSGRIDNKFFLVWTGRKITDMLGDPERTRPVRGGQGPMYRRLLYYFLTAQLNEHPGNERGRFDDDTWLAARRMMRVLDKDRKLTEPLARIMQPSAVLMCATVMDADGTAVHDGVGAELHAEARLQPSKNALERGGAIFSILDRSRVQRRAVNWLKAALALDSPGAAYNAACYYSAISPDTPDSKTVSEISNRLGTAFLQSDLVDQARSDPELARHRNQRWFKKLIAGAQSSS